MPSLDRCRSLIQAADELRFRDPGRALEQARVACETAAREPRGADDRGWHLLQSEAWAVLGSAYRAVGDFQRAENGLHLASAFLDALPESAVEPAVWARLCQRASYVRCGQGRFAEALDLNDDALAVYRRVDDVQSALAALVDRALIVARRGAPEAAIPLLEQSLEGLDPEVHPRSHVAAVHNMACYRLQVASTVEEEQEALEWLERARLRHNHLSEPLGPLQLQAVAALTAIRFGRRAEGVEALWRAHEGLQKLRAQPEQMLILLYLAECAVVDGEDDEVLRIAGLLFPLLGNTRLPSVARSGLLRFVNAARSGSATREMVTRVTDELRQATGTGA